MEEFESLSERLARVTAECEQLREENHRLLRLLARSGTPPDAAEVKGLVAEYRHIVVDECHHLAAVSFELVMVA